MTTSPGPGTGSGTSSQRRTSGSPGSVMTTACIPSPLLVLCSVAGLLTLSFLGRLPRHNADQPRLILAASACPGPDPAPGPGLALALALALAPGVPAIPARCRDA